MVWYATAGLVRALYGACVGLYYCERATQEGNLLYDSVRYITMRFGIVLSIFELCDIITCLNVYSFIICYHNILYSLLRYRI